MEPTIVLSVKCPHCKTSLMDDSTILKGKPGIRINIETEKERGVLWLCPIYNCFTHKSNIEIADDEPVKFFCPHCNKSLNSDIRCKLCDASLVDLNINIGGKVHVCSRKGCKNHFVVFEDLNDALRLLYDKFDNQ